jgi:hypothetical protein
MPEVAVNPLNLPGEPASPQQPATGVDQLTAATAALTPTAHLPWWILPSLAIVLLLIFAGALVASCFLDDKTLRTQMFTGALTLATGAAGYFFGSSAGSQKKDDQIARSTAALAVSTPPVATVTRTEIAPDSSGGATTITTTAPVTTGTTGP